MPRYSAEQIYAYALEAGFDPQSATTMTAIALAESRGSSDAHATRGEDSRGLWQVNARAHPDLARQYDLWDPADNARAAFEISHGGRDVSPWTTTHGGSRATYIRFRGDAQAAAVAHGEEPGLGVWTGTKGYGHKLAASPDLTGSHQRHDQRHDPTSDRHDVSGATHTLTTDPAVTAAEPAVAATGTAGPDSGVVLAPAEEPPPPRVELVTELPADHVVPLDAPLPAEPVAPAREVVVEPPAPAPATVTTPTADTLVPAQPSGAALQGQPAPVVDVVPAAPSPASLATAAAPVVDVVPAPASGHHDRAPDRQPEAPAGDDRALRTFLEVAAAQKGDAYVMGAQAKMSDPNPSVFDCAELVRWASHQAGVDMPDGSWLQYLHLKEAGTLIPVSEAKRTPGALLFSFSSEPVPGGGRPSHSHVAISDGEGHTIEARGRAYGVGSWETGRRFDYAAVIPGLEGDARPGRDASAPRPPSRQADQPAAAQHGAGRQGEDGVRLDAPLGAPAAGLAPPALGGAVVDTDRDLLPDDLERSLGTDPHAVDTDRDGLRDSRELLYTHTDPLVADAPADRFDAAFADGADVDLAASAALTGEGHAGGGDGVHVAGGILGADGHPPGHDQDDDVPDGDTADDAPGHASGVTLSHPLISVPYGHDGPDDHATAHHDLHAIGGHDSLGAGGDHAGHGL